jgi:peptide/nickel transport system substrate-binding protein
MRELVRKRFLVPGLVLGLSVGALSSLSSAAQPKPGGTLTVGILKDLSLMNPLVKTSSMDRRIRGLMFEPLLGMDLKGNIQPNLALEWKVSKDGKLYSFKLRKGVKFHNDQEMTAEDIKFAMDYTMNPANAAFGFSRLSLVERAEAADKHTLNVYLKSASAGFLSSLTDIKTFSVIPRGSLPEGISKVTEYPPGTGPFKFVEWRPGERIIFARHEHYWGRKAFVDKVVFRPIKEDSVRFIALQAGDVDMIEATPFEWAKQITEGKLKGIGFSQAVYGGYDSIRFNVAAPPFDNKKLRQAVAHAIDRREILHAAHFGFGEPTDQNYPKGHAWYFEGAPWPTYDLSKAKALLKDAGYNGQTIEIMISQEVAKQTMAATLQAQLRKIGMNVKIHALDYGAFTTRERRGDFAFTFSGGSPKADPWDTYGPHLSCERDLKKRQSNTSGYCNGEMDSLLRRAETELDPDKRKGLFKQIVMKVAEDLPILYVGFTPDFITFRDDIKGFVSDHDASLQWWGGGLSETWLDR